MNMTLVYFLEYLQDVRFSVIGPFLVADFSQAEHLYNGLDVATYGMEEVREGKITMSHYHDFISLYKSCGLNVFWNEKELILPERALTIVLPGVEHSWVAKKDFGFVGSLDERHAKQVLVQKIAHA